ncbi:hypothetical protein KW791_01860 [Candidatus Parcubacteria bacterium]|nr:hypothetical protein [Candidatus Parcubacteria bacterium]
MLKSEDVPLMISKARAFIKWVVCTIKDHQWSASTPTSEWRYENTFGLKVVRLGVKNCSHCGQTKRLKHLVEYSTGRGMSLDRGWSTLTQEDESSFGLMRRFARLALVHSLLGPQGTQGCYYSVQEFAEYKEHFRNGDFLVEVPLATIPEFEAKCRVLGLEFQYRPIILQTPIELDGDKIRKPIEHVDLSSMSTVSQRWLSPR